MIVSWLGVGLWVKQNIWEFYYWWLIPIISMLHVPLFLPVYSWILNDLGIYELSHTFDQPSYIFHLPNYLDYKTKLYLTVLTVSKVLFCRILYIKNGIVNKKRVM